MEKLQSRVCMENRNNVLGMYTAKNGMNSAKWGGIKKNRTTQTDLALEQTIIVTSCREASAACLACQPFD